VERCLEKDRDARFPSALALADAIEDVLGREALETLDLDALVMSQTSREGSVRTTLDARGTQASMSGTAKLVDPEGDPTMVSPPLFTSSVHVVPEPAKRHRTRAALVLGVFAIAGIGGFFAMRSSPVKPPEPAAATTATAPSVAVVETAAAPKVSPSIVAPAASSAPVIVSKPQVTTKKPKQSEPPAHEGVLRAGF
jgi:hypothetical protein